MSLLASLAALAGVAASSFLFAGIGRLFLRTIRFVSRSRQESLLVSVALGAIVFLLLVSAGEAWIGPRAGPRIAVAFSAVLGLVGIRGTLAELRGAWLSFAAQETSQRAWAALVAAVLLLQGFAAMAPLTGSDALHYHFTAQQLILREGFRANWFLSHGFFSGLGHQFILAGLALDSEKLALGWIFLGGAAAAMAIVLLVRQWTAGTWPWVAALSFLLTPVVFWQVTTAGSPDIWMAFFVPLCVLLIARAKEARAWQPALLAGLLAGGIAGTKYTGLILAGALFLAFVVELRAARLSFLFFASATFAGLFPYLRNWIWTGDPVFPFLAGKFAPEHFNAFAYASYRADTGASAHAGFWRLVEFPFFAAIDPAHPGFWLMLGPLVLCFAPLTLFAVKNTPLWRVTLSVWIVASLGIGFSSGMARFLLPLLPLGLAATFAGVAFVARREWRAVNVIARFSVAAFLLMGLGGLCLYARPSWSVAAGFTSRESYLLQRAPDYAKCEFLNQQLAGKGSEGRVMVFLRHVYYLRVPFAYGDPQSSWAVDPARLQSDSAWLRLFRENHIRWVAHDAAFPRSIQEPLKRLENENILVPCASTVVENWRGNRIGGTREQQSFTLDCVQR